MQVSVLVQEPIAGVTLINLAQATVFGQEVQFDVGIPQGNSLILGNVVRGDIVLTDVCWVLDFILLINSVTKVKLINAIKPGHLNILPGQLPYMYLQSDFPINRIQ